MKFITASSVLFALTIGTCAAPINFGALDTHGVSGANWDLFEASAGNIGGLSEPFHFEIGVDNGVATGHLLAGSTWAEGHYIFAFEHARIADPHGHFNVTFLAEPSANSFIVVNEYVRVLSSDGGWSAGTLGSFDVGPEFAGLPMAIRFSGIPDSHPDAVFGFTGIIGDGPLPEPSSAVLLGIGLCALFQRRRINRNDRNG